VSNVLKLTVKLMLFSPFPVPRIGRDVNETEMTLGSCLLT
jgi:hypothetical protein